MTRDAARPNPPLPVDSAIPDLLAAIRDCRRAVLEAPPGSGKTTRAPLALMNSGLVPGRVVMLEPRRIAARAAAEYMAESLGQPVGETVGYRMRGATKISRKTQVEVVTEGVLTRMLQDNPELPGVGAVIFDEFHERSLDADLGLALCLDVADSLREDLALIAMSATLDGGPVADHLRAPRIAATGRVFDVEIRWLEAPLPPRARAVDAFADLILRAEAETRETGSGILAFLPGEAEIRRVASLVRDRIPDSVTVRQLYGALPFSEQRAAIAPQRDGRKLVLATSIAESSLTLPDIRVVADMGAARRSRFDPGSGMSRLVTERATRAEADQRAGRAGRVAEGVAYRLWTKGEHGALASHAPPEIESADLAGLALELAAWGSDRIPFLTRPPAPALAGARKLLELLGAIDGKGAITAHGRKIAALPLHPRLAHALAVAGSDAAVLAATLAGRDILGRDAPADLALRLEAVANPGAFRDARPYPLKSAALAQVREESRRLRARAPEPRSGALSPAAVAALAFPDRVARRRRGDMPRFLLAGGKGAALDPGDSLADAKFVVAADLDGNPREARIRRAIEISEAEIRSLFADRICWLDECAWSRRDRKVVSRRREALGAISLAERAWPDAPAEIAGQAMLDGVRELGLRLEGPAARLAARVELARANGAELPDFSGEGLLNALEEWLLPFLGDVRDADAWSKFDPMPALRTRLGHGGARELDRIAPPEFATPLGNRVPIDYSGGVPEIAVRLQEMFGVVRHPEVAGTPLKVTLLSPARRPVQVTRDLPGFWSGSYADVRKDMRARYPKHPWPEDPTLAEPTLRTSPKRRRT